MDKISACRGLAGIGAPYVGPACGNRGLRFSEPPALVGSGGGSRKGHGLGPAYEVVQKQQKTVAVKLAKSGVDIKP